VPRTEGVSTTDLVGRILLVSKDHLHKDVKADRVREVAASPFTRVTRFLPTSHKIVQFSEGQVILSPLLGSLLPHLL
jgi:ethanolamine-phosphate cytidylyltransferase